MLNQEFESVVRNHLVPVPAHIPEGSRVKITALSGEAAPTLQRGKRFKALLCGIAEGLSDADVLTRGSAKP
jgi:hypothetical protein